MDGPDGDGFRKKHLFRNSLTLYSYGRFTTKRKPFIHNDIRWGGNFLTQSQATNFHTFATRMTLPHGIPPENFREVTPAEKAEIEKADASWSRPPQALINAWNAVCRQYDVSHWGDKPVGRYNEDTGFFELNGIKDITDDEAVDILTVSHLEANCDPKELYGFGWKSIVQSRGVSRRTYFPTKVLGLGAVYKDTFRNNTAVEVVAFRSYYGAHAGNGSTFAGTFDGCTALRDAGDLGMALPDATAFRGCTALEEVRFGGLYGSRPAAVYDLRWSPRLSLASVKTLAVSADKAAASATVHPEVFAKLADENNAEWHAVMLTAAENKITFISADPVA